MFPLLCFVLCTLFFVQSKEPSTIIVQLFSTTTPVLSRSAARLRVRAARRASLPADGPTRNTLTRCWSLPRPRAAETRPELPEPPSPLSHSLSNRHSTRPPACAVCNQTG